MNSDNNFGLLNKAEGAFFYFITFQLLWVFWAGLPGANKLYMLSTAAMVITALLIYIDAKLQNKCRLVATSYLTLVWWSLIMVAAYSVVSEYTVHLKMNFMFWTMDSYSVFFVRMIILVLPCMIYVDLNEFKDTRFKQIVMLVILAVSAFFVLRVLRINPNAIRERNSMTNFGYENEMRGVPTYSVVYSFSMLFPVFIHKCRTSFGKSRLIYVISSIIMGYIIIVSQFATALILAVTGSVVYLFSASKGKRRVLWLAFLIAFILLFAASDGFANIFSWLSEHVNGAWSKKLKDIAVSFSGGEDSGQISGRTSLYKESLHSFFKNPLFGMLLNPSADIGGHSTAVDVLAISGIFGFFPLALCIWQTFVRYDRVSCSLKENKPIIIACTIQFIILLFSKNIITSTAVFFTYFALIPLLIKMREEPSDERS